MPPQNHFCACGCGTPVSPGRRFITHHNWRVEEPLEIRFWKYVQKTETCWLWTGAKSKAGYGMISHKSKQFLTHRLSYQYFFGEIPKGLFICHKCDVPNCVNPYHLFAGTQKDNMQDGALKNRMGKGKPKKHEKHPKWMEDPEKKKQAIEKMRASLISRWGKIRAERAAQQPSKIKNLRPMAKLTEDQVLFIKENPQIRSFILAQKFGVTPSTICDIRQGRCWKDIQARPSSLK